MRRAGVLFVLVLCAGLYVACDDGGVSDVTLADLVGSWVADQFEFTNQANRAESVDFVAAGADVIMTVASNGRYTAAAVAPFGGGGDVLMGALAVEDGYLLMTDDEEPGETIAFSVDLSGGVLTIFSDELYFDFDVPPDDIEEPADLRGVFRVATGTTVADVVGAWEATEFRFVSSPTPTDTIDVIALGGGLSVTLDPDARYTLLLEMPGELPEIQYGVMMIVGDMMFMLDDVDPGDPGILEYGLVGGTITLLGADVIDFDDPPDGIDDPAVLEIVLERL